MWPTRCGAAQAVNSNTVRSGGAPGVVEAANAPVAEALVAADVMQCELRGVDAKGEESEDSGAGGRARDAVVDVALQFARQVGDVLLTRVEDAAASCATMLRQ